MKRIDQLPAVLTSFAYRQEYFSELEGMLVTVRKHHPDWHLVIGRGPMPGFDSQVFEVESPYGKSRWNLPVSFELDGSERDWHRIVFMKGWWMSEVWHRFGSLVASSPRRIVWLDADGRLNGPLDVELETDAEVISSPWWTDPLTPEPEHHICSGLLIFQGVHGGVVESIIDRWREDCIAHINLPLSPSPFVPGPEGDQCLLTKIVKSSFCPSDACKLIKLEYAKYCGVPDYKTGTPKQGALIDQWMMNEKMRLPQDRARNWPPPEDQRHPQAETQKVSCEAK